MVGGAADFGAVWVVFSKQYPVSSIQCSVRTEGIMSETLPYARGFRELVVYQKSRALTQSIFKLSQRFPREEAYSLSLIHISEPTRPY